MQSGVGLSTIQRIEQGRPPFPTRRIVAKLSKVLPKLSDNGIPAGVVSGSSPVLPLPVFAMDISAGAWVPIELCELDYNDPRYKAIVDLGRFRVRVDGDSMEPVYRNGSQVEFVILRAYDAPVLNANYLICRCDNTGTFKNLVAMNEDTYTLAAINQRKYPGSFTVPRQEITRIARAVGSFLPDAAEAVPIRVKRGRR